jgi:hypothetical protein
MNLAGRFRHALCRSPGPPPCHKLRPGTSCHSRSSSWRWDC